MSHVRVQSMLPDIDYDMIDAQGQQPFEWTDHELEPPAPCQLDIDDSAWSEYNPVGSIPNAVYKELTLFYQPQPHLFLPPNVCRSISGSHSEADYTQGSSLRPTSL